MTPEKIAKVCHEANRAYCENLEDTTQLKWEDAPAWQRSSAIMGAKFHMSNPNSKPEDSHNEWLKVKEKDGWTYGETKDVEEKIHPCFVPYEELPKDQKVKNSLFIAIVRALI